MKWSEVIQLADSTFRNTFDTPTKIKWLRFALAQVLQLKFSRDVTFAFFDIWPNIQDYDLPDNCEPDDIVSVQMETGEGTGVYKDCLYQDLRELPESIYYYTILNGMIHLGVKPNDQRLGLIYYVGTPDLTEEDLDDPIPLPLAYQELMVHALCERMAAARGDAVRKNNFKSDFDSLLTDYLMNQLNNVPEYVVPKDEMPRRAGR